MICCKECLDLLHDYLDGELAPDVRQNLAEHFSDCPPCVAFLATYKTTTKVCRETLGAIEIPAEVQDKLRNFLRENAK